MTPPVVCLVDGVPAVSLPVDDSTVLRGDGCFEAVRSYDGHLFRLDQHLDRLEFSASALGLTVPPRAALGAWAAEVAVDRGDCVVRIVLSRGPAIPGVDGGERCLVMSHPLPRRVAALRLMPVAAPWHPAGRPWDLAGVKTVSYAPNLAASRQAVASGFDDALLTSDDSVVLEGPTFTVGWVRGGSIFTPTLALGILASITRRLVMELVDVSEVVADLDSVLEADEVFAMSTIKEVTPVVAVDHRSFSAGPVTAQLAQRVELAVAEAGAGQSSPVVQPR